MPAKDKKKSEAAAAKKDPSQISAELTKTKAKKCLMVNYGDVSERKNILKEIKKNFPSAKVEKLKKGFLEGHNYQFNVFVELNDAKQTKEAKELLSKSFQGKPIAVGLVLSQKKKVENIQRKTADEPVPKVKEAAPVVNGAMGDRQRGLFEIRVPKIIIRNLNFNVKEEALKTEMEKFGPVTLVTLPKKDDGKLKGFGFVVFDYLNDAKKAIESLNARKDKFMGTKIACDWCIPKNLFIKNTEEAKIDKENVEKEKKRKNTSDGESDEDADDDENESGCDEEESNDEESKDAESAEEDKPKKASKRKADDTEQKVDKFVKKKIEGTRDVQEQRTVFVRNLSYDTTVESLTEAFSFFGPIQYVKICMDKGLERPKGTAFVCFQDSQHAINACIESDSFEVDSRKVTIDLAVSREKAYNLIQDRKAAENEPSDNRNLALAKEGVIYANSYEAKDVSKADMMRRQKLEESNRLKLQILHYFVSPTRLSVHNLPIKCSDQELRAIFQTAIGEDPNSKTFIRSKIVECRIMRDMTRVNAEGVHRSKGFGFVELSTTELAKKALAALNNNPEVFKGGPRPIVQFSIEDMRALKKKQERHERAQLDRKKTFSKPFVKNQRNGKPSGSKRIDAEKNPRQFKKAMNKGFNLAPKKREEGGQVEKRHTEAKASANKKPFNKKPFNKKPFDKKKFNKKKN